MRVHALYHVPFENIGSMAIYFDSGGHNLNVTRLWLGEPLPDQADFDMLVIMGGPMGVHDEVRLAWLAGEKRFIEATMKRNKVVMGRLRSGPESHAGRYAAFPTHQHGYGKTTGCPVPNHFTNS